MKESVASVGRIVIDAPSHVHLGNPDLHGGAGRLYGTLGLTLDTPRLILKARQGSGVLQGLPSWARNVYDRLSREYDCRLDIAVESLIPRGIGLGGTTPLYLALAEAFHRLCGSGSFDPARAAYDLGRSRVSALGLYAYMYGGFLFDGGFKPGVPRPPPLVFRAQVPEWISVVVAVPRGHVDRIRSLKEREDEILESMPRMDESMAMRLSRIVLMGILANVADGDWVEAGRWMTEFNRMLGEYWSGEQGGVYCCSEAEEIIEAMLASGAMAAAQSSWGPAVYALVDSDGLPRVVDVVSRIAERVDAEVIVTRPRNQGVRVSIG